MLEVSDPKSSETKGAGRVLVLDFGSQFTQLIARRIREQQVYCEIHPGTMSAAAVAEWDPAGIVLSGGPSSVYADGAPDIDLGILDQDRPIFAICYGMQLLAHRLGGHVEAADDHEYGRAGLAPRPEHADDPLFAGGPVGERTVWMSHGDRVQKLPEGFITLASSENSPFAAVRHRERPIWGVQFHPEVAHTEGGDAMLRSFVHDVCGCRGSWTMERFIEGSIERVKQQVGEGHAICGLSGGVDSSVAAALVHRAIGDQLTCIFVDHGLLRQGEREEVEALFRDVLHTNLVTVDASAEFLGALAGVAEPERKRKIIGGLFIETFDREAARLAEERGSDGARFLVQGTLYPDVIESVSVKGPSDTIKTHHNVGGLPEDMNFELVEPLRELFKDEVREVGRRLGLPPHVVGRHPFPGPGLAIRVMGDVSEDKLRPLRQADAIMLEEIRRAGLYDEIWQALAVFLPVQSVGVMGDMRTYENVIALRMVTSSDAMTADWARVPPDVLATISSRIINEVKGINRVVYDISSKPPATIEWE